MLEQGTCLAWYHTLVDVRTRLPTALHRS